MGLPFGVSVKVGTLDFSRGGKPVSSCEFKTVSSFVFSHRQDSVVAADDAYGGSAEHLPEGVLTQEHPTGHDESGHEDGEA